VDLDAGDDTHRIRENARDERDAGPEERVRDAVREERMEPGVARQDLDRPHAPRRRIAIADGRDVLTDLSQDPRQALEWADHRL
jgi:hypothetical protein